MKKLIASVIVAFGLFLSAFVTSSAMAGSYTVGIIAATGKVDTTGSETEGGGDQEKTTTTITRKVFFMDRFLLNTHGVKSLWHDVRCFIYTIRHINWREIKN